MSNKRVKTNAWDDIILNRRPPCRAEYYELNRKELVKGNERFVMIELRVKHDAPTIPAGWGNSEVKRRFHIIVPLDGNETKHCWKLLKDGERVGEAGMETDLFRSQFG